MRHAWTTTVFLTAAMLVGCGDDKPTAAEKRAAKARWTEHVNAACRKASGAIAARGYPGNLVDLDRLVVRGIGDVQAAIKTIGHERLPVGADSHPRAFVRELQALGPALEKFSNTSEKLKPNALVAGVDGLKLRLARIGEEAEKAGVRDCRTTRVRLIVPAAVRAPVFAEQFNQLEHRELSRLRKIGFPQVDTPAEYGRALERLAGLLDRSLDGIGRLDPPLWAAQQTADYERALRDLQSAVQAFAAQIEHDHGRPPAEIDLATYRRLYRKIRATGRAETKAHRKMLRAVGAAPTFPPGDGADVEPDSSQES